MQLRALAAIVHRRRWEDGTTSWVDGLKHDEFRLASKPVSTGGHTHMRASQAKPDQSTLSPSFGLTFFLRRGRVFLLSLCRCLCLSPSWRDRKESRSPRQPTVSIR